MFQHMLKGQRNGAHLVVVDPRRTASARWANEHVALRVGSDIALANAIAHVVIAEGLQHAWFIDNSTRGYEEFRASVAAHHAGVGGARGRRARRADPADRPALRDGRPGHHLLDARDHRAPQRGRQRPRAHQPGPPHRPRRPARLRAQSPAGPEQRPGRRRHGRGAAEAARLPGRLRPREAAPLRGALGRAPLVGPGPERDRDARRRRRGRASRPLRHRGEPGGLGRGHAPRGEGARPAGLPDRRGPVPHADGAAGARRPAGGGRAGARPRAR